ncbi:glucokinase [Roseovarius sp. CAU 1744]|uniref:glucokinase n=1 Tax=Roseovarius sp. CAU 1744 TaxID=3140368 RepID=UPI00325B0BC7
MAERYLLADVGGTNTRVGLGDAQGVDPASVQIFSNAGHADLGAILDIYLALEPGPVTAFCAGVAGPVRGGKAQLTNLDWLIDTQDLRRITGAGTVHLLNDLQAQGYALDDLAPESVIRLFPGAPAPRDSSRLVLGLGTGCNIAVAHRLAGGLFVPPSETGHSSLPHLEGDAGALIGHLAQTHYHKPLEAALSGPGLSRIFRYLTGDTLSAADIVDWHARGDIEATAALTLFSEILGTVAGNIALAHLPMGGVYLIGGTARAVAPHLAGLGFLDHFIAKGPYTPIMRDIPVFLIDDDSAALHGCARYLRQLLAAH